MELPIADQNAILASKMEYEELKHNGGGQAAESCFRYIWNLVHSQWRTDAERGKKLAYVLMESKDLDEVLKRDLVYLICVAEYKQGNLIQARKQLAALLQVNPECRQAQTLKAAVDDQVVKEGLIGIGIGAGVLGIIGIGIAAIVGGRR
eukprot:jgi/Botrbrau1/12058/Bobra.0295s0013.1